MSITEMLEKLERQRGSAILGMLCELYPERWDPEQNTKATGIALDLGLIESIESGGVRITEKGVAVLLGEIKTIPSEPLGQLN